MSKYEVLLLIITVLMTLIQNGLGRQCYFCESYYGDTCGISYSVNTTDLPIRDCPNEHNFCSTTDSYVDGARRIRRDCSGENPCVQPRALINSTTCILCDWNLCNSSPVLIHSLAIISTCLVLIKFC